MNVCPGAQPDFQHPVPGLNQLSGKTRTLRMSLLIEYSEIARGSRDFPFRPAEIRFRGNRSEEFSPAGLEKLNPAERKLVKS